LGVAGSTVPGEDGPQVIKAAASRIKERCSLVAEALPGSIVETENAETRVEAIVTTWYAAAHESPARIGLLPALGDGLLLSCCPSLLLAWPPPSSPTSCAPAPGAGTSTPSTW
jgi:hypothetical protein